MSTYSGGIDASAARYLARIAAELAPWGVVSRRDLVAAGLGGRAIDVLLRTGALERCGRGVYRLPFEQPAPSPHPDSHLALVAVWRNDAAAGLVAAGADAVLARAAAAAAWGLDGFEPPVPIVVGVPRSSGRRGTRLHRIELLEPPDVVDGLAVTGIGQTLVEVGAGLSAYGLLTPQEQVELALESALRRQLVTVERLAELVAARPKGHRGAAVLRRVLARRPRETPATGSYLETRGVQVLRRGGIDGLARQVELWDHHGFIGRVDLFAPASPDRPGVVIEFDGEEHHTDFERDRRRWTRLAGAGHRLAVFTWGQVEHEPQFVVQSTAALLRP